VAAGGSNNNFTLSRFNVNGSLDNTFSADGMQTTGFAENAFAYSVAIKNDGQIVAAGASGNVFALARYNVDGSIDNTFDGDGKLTDYVRLGSTFYTGSAIQNNGKLVTAGYTWNGSNYDYVVSRYNTNGSPDSTFSGDGSEITDFGSDDRAYSVAIQSDGKIVAAGSAAGNFALVRYNTDGSLDNTFSSDGKQTTDFSSDNDIVRSIAIQSDGKIVAAGGAPNSLAIARYNTDGSLDNTFANDGTQTLTSLGDARSVAIQADGKIVTLGGTEVFEIVRLNTDGSLDNTFGNNGVQTTNYFPEANYEEYNLNFGRSVAIQNDGKIVAGGYYEYGRRETDYVLALGRYNQNGSLDSSFSEDGMQILSRNDYIITSIALQTNGKIVVAGYIRRDMNNDFALFRYNNDGNIDSSFGTNGIQVTPVSDANDEIQSIAIADSKLYAFGNAQYPDNIGVIVRFLLDNEDKAPTVTLVIPSNIVKYTGPARIKLNAAVANITGKITKVQLYNGTTLLHTETKAPYGFLWNNVREGNYTLTAKAFDNSGNVTTSNSIKVSVVDENVPPVVNIVSPVDDTTYTSPATIRLIADAEDGNDKISKVEFYNGTTLLRTEYYYPYTYIWTNVKPGTYTITAKAYDDKGLSATSAPVTVTVTNAAMVSRPSFSNDKTDLNNALSLKLSPVPARSTLQISTKGLQLNKPLTISVISASGVVIKTIQSNNQNKVVQLDVSSMISGVYSLKIISGDKILYKQFVKL